MENNYLEQTTLLIKNLSFTNAHRYVKPGYHSLLELFWVALFWNRGWIHRTILKDYDKRQDEITGVFKQFIKKILKLWTYSFLMIWNDTSDKVRVGVVQYHHKVGELLLKTRETVKKWQ